jgi:hypothetical protein
MVPEKPGDPLLIEWNGESYEQVSSGAEHGQPTAWRANGSRSKHHGFVGPSGRPAISSAMKSNAAVLVYRDGHRETVREYSIIGGILYAAGDYWQSGAWTRRIPLTAIDIPASREASKAAGATFLLPTGPNVVVASF